MKNGLEVVTIQSLRKIYRILVSMEGSNLISSTHDTIELAPGMPKAFTDILMPCSKRNYAEGSYGRFLCQEVESGLFIIHYDVYDIQTRFLVHIKRKVPSLMICVALKNNIH